MSQTPLPPPFQAPHYSPAPPPPRRTGLSPAAKVLIGVGIGVGVMVFVVFSILAYIGMKGPDTKVVPGRQLPARFVSEIQGLNLLEQREQIEFFYSDALMDIKDGFYLLTDRKVIIYSQYYYGDPAWVIPFSEIADLSVNYDDSFWADSLISITLTDETVATFPVSSEAGGDKRFYNALMKKWKAAQGES
ncbi:MAG: hypothetical protein MI923_10480 [Phycisphaerales bacterium]|nr:hypothetical protein [Phycisphaerales bacterium]